MNENHKSDSKVSLDLLQIFLILCLDLYKNHLQRTDNQSTFY